MVMLLPAVVIKWSVNKLPFGREFSRLAPNCSGLSRFIGLLLFSLWLRLLLSLLALSLLLFWLRRFLLIPGIRARRRTISRIVVRRGCLRRVALGRLVLQLAFRNGNGRPGRNLLIPSRVILLRGCGLSLSLGGCFDNGFLGDVGHLWLLCILRRLCRSRGNFTDRCVLRSRRFRPRRRNRGARWLAWACVSRAANLSLLILLRVILSRLAWVSDCLVAAYSRRRSYSHWCRTGWREMLFDLLALDLGWGNRAPAVCLNDLLLHGE